MVRNYSYTRESEENLFHDFLKFINHVKKCWGNLLEEISNKKCLKKSSYEKFYEFEEKSNRYQSKISNECIWNISCNAPIASHLRYVISIINSLIDLERMSDYFFSCSRFFYEKSINDKQILNILIDAVFYSNELMNKIFDIIIDNENDNNATKRKKIYNPAKTYDNAMSLAIKYHAKYNMLINQLAEIVFAKKIQKEVFVGAIIVLKNTERNVDHAINIIENFISIRHSNFFYEKHSKHILGQEHTKIKRKNK